MNIDSAVNFQSALGIMVQKKVLETQGDAVLKLLENVSVPQVSQAGADLADPAVGTQVNIVV